MPNRTTAPELQQIEKIDLIQPQKYELNNGIPAYVINAGTQDVTKIEFIFKAGSWYDKKHLVSDSVNALLNAGTSRFTSEKLADSIDYYGAYLEVDADYDQAIIAVYSLNKYLPQVLPFIEELIKDAIFPENELSIHIKNSKQNFQVSEGKVGDVCRKRFRELIYGTQHPYGLYPTLNDYDQLTRTDLTDFYKQHYHSGNCTIIASGKIPSDLIDVLDKHFGRNDWQKSAHENKMSHFEENMIATKEVVFKENAIQSAIRIGNKLFNKTHPDYHAMQVLNTILGGYYGSRLMKNIREDKGFTYGINSGIASLKNSGYFYISTEVGVDVCQQAIDEIYREINHIKTEIIPDEELQLVKNYMTGMFLKGIDGPFSLANYFKGLLVYNLDYEYYNNYLRTIKTATPEKLQALAQQYLNVDKMTELVVGKK